MMSKKEFWEQYSRLCAFYSRQAETTTGAEWFKIFNKYDVGVLTKAVDDWAESQQRFPTPAGLVQTIRIAAQHKSTAYVPPKPLSPEEQVRLAGLISEAKTRALKQAVSEPVEQELSFEERKKLRANTPGYDSKGVWSTALWHAHLDAGAPQQQGKPSDGLWR